MASDSLNQVGKFIGKTAKNADYALKKSRPNRPPVERTRDIFDENNNFEMEFMVNKNQRRVSLSLGFEKPPPMKGCFECSPDKGFCEAFHDVPMGTAILPLSHRVLPDSVQVYVNNVWWPPSMWNLIGGYGIDPNPGAIEVFGLPLPLNEVDICYVEDHVDNYTGDAFAAIYQSGGGNTLTWYTNGDNPSLGWLPRPLQGPVAYVKPPFTDSIGTVQILQDMVVRISVLVEVGYVTGGPVTEHTIFVNLNGVRIGADPRIQSAGLQFIGGGNSLDLRNIQVKAGDIITATGFITNNIFLGGFETLPADLSTYILVGRGHYDWGAFGIWDGP